MSDVGAVSSIGAMSYAHVDWRSIKSIEGHPLEFLLNKGIPVYYKVHRGAFLAFRYYLRSLETGRNNRVPELSANGLELFATRQDDELLLLRLNDEDLHEILVTDSRGVIDLGAVVDKARFKL
jgi:hypothetical protein